jgi:PUA domain protein
MQVKSRHHLRSDAVGDVERSIANALGVEVDGEQYELVEFEDDVADLVLVDGEPLVTYVDGEPFLAVRGLNAYDPDRRVVTVDAGAISFVSNGADVMRPGIVKADPDIAAGDLVGVAEQSHGKFLAVGCALVDGEDMGGQEGRVVESLHHVGDDRYEFAP